MNRSPGWPGLRDASKFSRTPRNLERDGVLRLEKCCEAERLPEHLFLIILDGPNEKSDASSFQFHLALRSTRRFVGAGPLDGRKSCQDTIKRFAGIQLPPGCCFTIKGFALHVLQTDNFLQNHLFTLRLFLKGPRRPDPFDSRLESTRTQRVTL